MVKIYFEGKYREDAKLVAMFDDIDTYVVCMKVLQRFAEANGYVLTESDDEDIELSDLIK